MLRAIASKSIGGARSRSISFAARNLDKVTEGSSSATPTGKAKSTLSNFELRILVWTKKFKSIEDIPDRIAYETINQCRSRFRVKVCNYMAVGIIIACIVMIMSGKRAANRGESVVNANLEWHKKYNEEAEAKERAEGKSKN